MSITNVSFDSKDEVSVGRSTSEYETGGYNGYGNMDIWTKDRQTKLRQLGAASFTNNAGFTVPSGIVDTKGFDTKFESHEKLAGVNARGSILDVGSSPLGGTAILEINGNTINDKTVTGSFVVNAPPQPGAVFGEDLEVDEYDFRFETDSAGLDVYQESIDANHDVGTIKYGQVNGNVTDYNGEPMGAEPVFGEGAGTRTDSNGYYEIKSPGGTEVGISAIGTTVNRTPTEGQSLTVDFQYSRLVIEVVTPDLKPVNGVEIRVGDESYKTDEEGKVVIDPAYITTYQMLISGEIYREVVVQNQGELYKTVAGNEGGSIGATITIIDEKTTENVSSCDCEFPSQGLVVKSNQSGKANLFSQREEDNVIVAKRDKRYEEKSVSIDPQAPGNINERVVVSRKKTGSTF